MVDALPMNNLLRALPSTASLLLVGDAEQLPSLGPSMVLRSLFESGVVLGSRPRPAIRGLSRNPGRWRRKAVPAHAASARAKRACEPLFVCGTDQGDLPERRGGPLDGSLG
jgi:hypothetical protein